MPRNCTLLKVWFFGVGFTGLSLLAFSAYRFGKPPVEAILVFGILIGLAEWKQVVLPHGDGISTGLVLVLSVLWVFGPVTAMGAEVAGSLAVALIARTQARVLLFNIGLFLWSVASGDFALRWVGMVPGLPLGSTVPWARLASGAFFSVTNAGLLGIALGMHKGQSPFASFRAIAASSWWRWVVSYGLAIAFYEGYQASGWWMLPTLGLGLVLFSWISAWVAERMREETVETLLDMASMQVPSKRRHSDNVMRYATAIAEDMGLPREEIQNLRYAALLHDIGVSVGLEDRLNQIVALGPEERLELLEHPLEGARLIGRVASLVRVAQIVKHHHERFDGFGYPEGLQGEAIPLGSRILAVANAYDAMISYRPYRQSLSPIRAVAELRKESGRQFDPTVVNAFLNALDRLDSADPVSSIDSTIEHLREYLTASGARKTRAVRLPFPVAALRRAILGDPGWGKAAGILALSRLGQTLNSSLSLDRALDLVVTRVSQLAGGACTLLLLNETEDGLVHSASQGFTAPFPQECVVKVGSHLPGRAVGERRPAFTHDLQKDYSSCRQCQDNECGWPYKFFRSQGIRSALAVPLVARGKILGALNVFTREGHRFSHDEINLLTAVAGQAALAIDNARLFTEVRQRYSALSEMKAFNDVLLEDANSAIVVLDESGRVRMINQTMRNIFREAGVIIPERPEGMPFLDVFPLESGNSHPVLKALETGQKQEEHNHILAGPEKKPILQVYATPLRDAGGELIGAVAISHDVTELKRMEEQVRQVEKLAVVGELAAGAAHEIRNPLTSVRGFIQLLQLRSSLSLTDREYLDIILSEIDRIDNIIHDLLLLARPSDPKLAECDLHRVLDEVAFLAENRKGSRAIKVEKRYGAEEALIRADERQIKQVFLNIISNAFEAMGEDGLLTISTGDPDPAFREPGFFCIRFSDTGGGIPPEVLPRIFDPFFTTKETGTGLGLAVTFRIVQNHGGKIEVENNPGLGATFQVKLPR